MLKREEIRKEKQKQKTGIIILILLYAAYLVAGIFLAVTHVHCRGDLPIYLIGGVADTVCVIVAGIHERKLYTFLSGKE